MHLLSCLLSAVLLSTGVLGFYPYTFPDGLSPGPSPDLDRRFYPWRFENAPQQAHVKVPTMDLIRVRGKVRRDRKFQAIMGSPPTMENSMAINTDAYDYSYFSILKFGSQGYELWMLLDTGAATTWVMGSNCTSTACQSHNTFGADHSATLAVTNIPWSIKYGTGSVGGVIVNDSVSLAGFNINLAFGSASNTSDDFLNYPMDGILGLGRADTQNGNVPTIMQVLEDAKLLKKNILGINLQRSSDGATDGQISFGDIDKTKFTGDITYAQVVSGVQEWEIPVDDVIVGDKALKFAGKTAVVDTGTSFILMPADDAKLIHSLIPNANAHGEAYTLPCSSSVTLQVVISGVKYTISPKDYVGVAAGSGNICTSNIIGKPPFGPNQWLLGDVFLKNVYAVFDYDQNKIGFATRSYTGSSSSSPSGTATSSLPDQPTISPLVPQSSISDSGPVPAQATQSAGPDQKAAKGASTSLPVPTWLSLAIIVSITLSWYSLGDPI